MRDTLLNYIDRFRHDRHERVVLGSVLLVLAMVVTLVVWWQLRYTGITMTNETFCGYEEHTHTDECYEYSLVCGLEEHEGHVHDESCYDEEGNLVCGLEETEGHTHDESCYEYTLVCGLEEHTHTVECLIDLNADVEDYEIWEATLPLLSGDLRTDIVNIAWSQLDYKESTANFSLGEDGETRYGYTRYGAWYGNEYGTWDAMFAAFCLYYAGIDESEFPLNSGAYAWAVLLKEAGAYAEASEATPSMGDLVFFDSDGDGRIDRVGIVTAVDESASMVTIIEGDYTVEGVDTVAEHIYPFSNTTIVGYGILPTDEDTDTETDTDEAEEEAADDIVYTASDGGAKVTVIAPAGALPDNAILMVSLLDEDSDEYANAAEAVGYEPADSESAIATVSEDDEDESAEETGTALAVLDISFVADGAVVEPTEAVTVTIDASSLMTDDADASTLEVQHLEETPEGVTPVLVADATDATEGTIDTETAVVEFTTESFSTFTITWSYGSGWQTNNVEVTATSYLYDGTTETTTVIGSDTITLTGTIGTAYNLTSSNSDLAIDGYTLDHANIVYTYEDRRDTITGTISNAISITVSSDGPNINYTFTTSSSSTSPNNVRSVTINLYYVKSSASITINKYETDTTTQLAGAEFTLTSDVSLEDVSVNGSYTLSNNGYTITFTTTDSSITFSDLPDGTYTLTETTAPDGYETAASFTFTVSDSVISSTDSRYSSGAVTIYDEPKTVTLTVNKVYTDAAGNELTGATDAASFTLTPTGSTTGSAETFTITGSDSYEIECHVNGTYTLSETDVPEGYVTPDDQTITIGDSDMSVTVTNTESVAVTVEKVYVLSDGTTVTTSGIDDLEATLTLTSGTTTIGSESVTGAGTVTFDGLSDGTYTVTETTVPGGYTTPDSVTFTISGGVIYDENGDEVTSVTITNVPDSTHSLAGMSYAIADLNSTYQYALSYETASYGSGLGGDEIEEVVTTDSDGIAYITADATLWTFEATGTDNMYYIYTTVNGVKYYINITDGSTSTTGLYVSTTPQAILVTEGTGTYAGQYRFSTGGNRNTAINWYGNSSGWGITYGAYNDGINTSNEMLTLCLIYEPDGVYITDNIAASGELVANYVVDGEAMDLTDSSKYTIVWEKDSPTIDTEACTWTYTGVYEEVTNEEALNDLNNYAVNVALDGGALAIYKVTIYDAVTGDEIGTATYQVPYADQIMNSSFEVPDLSSGIYNYQYPQGSVPFWSTTGSDSQIEIGDYEASQSTYGTHEIYAGGNQAYSGDQFAELNAQAAGSLYQDVLTMDGESLNWSLYHRARTDSGSTVTDTMYVVIMSAEDAQAVLDYADANNIDQQTLLTTIIKEILSEGDDLEGTNAADSASGSYTLGNGVTVDVTVWQLTTTTDATGEWTYYYGEYEVPDEQYLTRFFFVAGDTGSGNNTVGNLIDYATFSQEITYVIEYWTRETNFGEYTLQSTYTQTETVYPGTNAYEKWLDYFTSQGYGLVGSVTGTSSGGSDPSSYDEITTTGIRVVSGTTYLSLYLSKPVVTVIKNIGGLSETEIDELLDTGNYTVTFTITPVGGGTSTTVTLNVGSTGVASDYTTELTAGVSYTISEVVASNSFLDDYDLTVTVDGATSNGDGTYTFTVSDESSLTITFTNTYAEVYEGGPEMPSTGGRGTKLYTMVGLLLICGAGYLLYRKQNRKCKWRWNI